MPFNSFEELREFIKIKAVKEFTKFYIADSESIEHARKIRNVTRPMNDALKYYKVVYKCRHGDKRRNGGIKQSTLKKDCPFFLQIGVSEDGQSLQVKRFEDKHNHGHDKVSVGPKEPCEYCGSLFVKRYFPTHRRYCFKNTDAKASSFTCDICGKTFKRKDYLREHIKRHDKATKPASLSCSLYEDSNVAVLNEHETKPASLPCHFKGCKNTFYTLSLLVHHLRNVHNAPLKDSQTLSFESEKLFFEWKEEEEARTLSFFPKHRSTNTKEGTTKYFYCQKHGSDRPHKRRGEVDRKTDKRYSRGRIKTGLVCTSFIKAQFLANGNVNAVYEPTHNHPIDPLALQYQPMSTDLCNFIDSLLDEGASPLQIREELRSRASGKADYFNIEKEHFKEYHVSLKRIKERARRRKYREGKLSDADDGATSQPKVLIDTDDIEDTQSSFSDAVMEPTTPPTDGDDDDDDDEGEGEEEGRHRHREELGRDMLHTLKEISLFIETNIHSTDKLPDDIMDKIKAGLDATLRLCKGSLEENEETPPMDAMSLCNVDIKEEIPDTP
ncbi:uncharacterized protein LOC111048083 [Nilaparvata lugens]|uniref:uncharacterized protein LOC111048083 n=1 Tax=Nilaparvata lugens TaxID=108931 RepID=UPI00193E29F7|nr:uncharacterized protein LOC111048083 [Nilaparvata lugens]